MRRLFEGGTKSGEALIRVNALFYHEILFVTWKLKRKQDVLGFRKVLKVGWSDFHLSSLDRVLKSFPFRPDDTFTFMWM